MKKKIILSAIVLAMATALTGCGKTGPGASAESSAGLDASQKLDLEKHKTIDKKIDAKITATIPASVSISDAAAEIWGFARLDGLTRPLRVAAKKPESFSLLAGTSTDADIRVRTAGLLLESHAARTGWDIDPEGKQLRTFFLVSAATAEFSSRVEAAIASTLSVAADPKAATAAAKASLMALPIPTLQMYDVEAVTAARRGLAMRVEPDLASGKGIGMTAGLAKYTADQSGWAIDRQGVKWFGGGFAEGRDYKVELESSVSKGTGVKQAITTSADAKQGVSDKATTEIK